MMLDQDSQVGLNPFTDLPFRCRIGESTTDGGGRVLYAFTEQIVGSDGSLVDADPPRTGTTALGWAFEINNRAGVPEGTLVWVRFRGMLDGQPVYDFVAPDGSSPVEAEDIDTGTEGHTVPLLDGANYWSLPQTIGPNPGSIGYPGGVGPAPGQLRLLDPSGQYPLGFTAGPGLTAPREVTVSVGGPGGDANRQMTLQGDLTVGPLGAQVGAWPGGRTITGGTAAGDALTLSSNPTAGLPGGTPGGVSLGDGDWLTLPQTSSDPGPPDSGYSLYTNTDGDLVAQSSGGVTTQLTNVDGAYSTSVGDGLATTLTVTHGLNTRDVAVTIREVASPYEFVDATVKAVTANTVSVTFAVAPTASQYQVTVLSRGSGDREISDGDKGDITVSASGATWTIDAGVVSYAKMQDISATQRLLGRNSAGAGDAEEVSVTQVLDWLSSTRGVVLYRGASGWAALSPGTSGQFLKTLGAGADPAWADAGGGGGGTLVASSVDFSAQSTVSFTGLTGYKFYRILGYNLCSSEAMGATLQLRTSTDNGSSYDSGGTDYQTGGGAGASSIAVAVMPADSGSDAIGVEMTALGLAGTTRYKAFLWQSWSATAGAASNGGGRLAAADIDAIQFLPSAGTFSGTLLVYGYN